MSKYHDYYDKLNDDKKDYEGEVLRLKRSFESASKESLDKILEVGAGTGNHTRYLCDIANHVHACDIDPEMIQIAKSKLKNLPITFYSDGVDSVDELNFPFCVMMWHVLNYFPDLETMYGVFSGVWSRLKPGGIFIFDAWNGVAVIRDLPKHATNQIEVDGQKIVHELRGFTDLMDQTTTIVNHIEIYDGTELKDKFSQEVVHYIWTAKTVTDVLKDLGFEIVKITKAGNYDVKADHTDWKIAYIVRKKTKGAS